jgi:hypothetical protein
LAALALTLSLRALRRGLAGELHLLAVDQPIAALSHDALAFGEAFDDRYLIAHRRPAPDLPDLYRAVPART